MRKLIFVCSPLRGDVATNQKNAIEYSKKVINEGHIPICPHIYLTQFFDDSKESDRTLGMEMARDLLIYCDEVWVFGDKISKGMLGEIKTATLLEIPIKKETV
jgi:hypothetical protein